VFRTTVLAILVCPLHAEVSAALAAADIATHATQARPPRLVAMHAEVLAAAATMASSQSTAACGGAALGFYTSAHCDPDGGRAWKKGDFPTDEALHPCRVKRHEDLPRHIYLLLDILGLQFRWLLTRMGIGRTLVSSEELAVDDDKERAWMALYANDRDVIEDLLYRRLRTLWSGCTDAIAIFSQHCAQEEFFAQKVWDALLTAFPTVQFAAYTIWWATQWINWRKENMTAPDAAEFRSYKDWVRNSGARAAAGMDGVPQSPE